MVGKGWARVVDKRREGLHELFDLGKSEVRSQGEVTLHPGTVVSSARMLYFFFFGSLLIPP